MLYIRMKRGLTPGERAKVIKRAYAMTIVTSRTVAYALELVEETGSPAYAVVEHMLDAYGHAYAPISLYVSTEVFTTVGRAIAAVAPDAVLEDRAMKEEFRRAEMRLGGVILPGGAGVVFEPLPIHAMSGYALRTLAGFASPTPVKGVPYAYTFKRLGLVEFIRFNGEKYAALRREYLNEVLAEAVRKARKLVCMARTILERVAEGRRVEIVRLRHAKKFVDAWLRSRFVPMPPVLRAYSSAADVVLTAYDGGGVDAAASVARRVLGTLPVPDCPK